MLPSIEQGYAKAQYNLYRMDVDDFLTEVIASTERYSHKRSFLQYLKSVLNHTIAADPETIFKLAVRSLKFRRKPRFRGLVSSVDTYDSNKKIIITTGEFLNIPEAVIGGYEPLDSGGDTLQINLDPGSKSMDAPRAPGP